MTKNAQAIDLPLLQYPSSGASFVDSSGAAIVVPPPLTGGALMGAHGAGAPESHIARLGVVEEFSVASKGMDGIYEIGEAADVITEPAGSFAQVMRKHPGARREGGNEAAGKLLPKGPGRYIDIST